MASQPVAAAASIIASARSRSPLWLPESSQITKGSWPEPTLRPAISMSASDMVRGRLAHAAEVRVKQFTRGELHGDPDRQAHAQPERRTPGQRLETQPDGHAGA